MEKQNTNFGDSLFQGLLLHPILAYINRSFDQMGDCEKHYFLNGRERVDTGI
jgi:hypothetical protein